MTPIWPSLPLGSSAQPGGAPQSTPPQPVPAQPPTQSPGPAAQPDQRAAQAALLAAATDRAVAAVAATTRARAQVVAQKARLSDEYAKQLAEIDRLKQRRASWRRDSLIRNQLRASHSTAEQLAAVDERIRQLGERLRKQQQALYGAVERERAGAPTAERSVELARWRRQAQRFLRRGAKKIVLPDDRIDPLADPEELEQQAALLRQTEKQLAEELLRMERQAARYQRMATLRAKRNRAVTLGAFDNDQRRRASGNGGQFEDQPNGADENDEAGEAGGTPTGGQAPPPSGPDDGPASDPPPDSPPESPQDSPPFDPGPQPPADNNEPPAERGDTNRLATVLADVVDTSTLDALRAADRSRDIAHKNRAVNQAQAQVRARLERLRRQRARMQKRANELRRR